MPAENKAELALEFVRSLTEMRNTVRRNIEAKTREAGHDISFELLEILGALWRKDGINQQELAGIIAKDKSSVTYLINNLVKRRMVRRTEDGNDRRNKRVFLTARGKKERKLVYSWVIEMYARATGNISATDISKSIALVKQMTENLVP
ncbi:MAG: MarR family transcriptional regulator [Chitinophagaceae bacterium]|nr:MarR family transcriptional regulator [Chitinophagaceae bacterium]